MPLGETLTILVTFGILYLRLLKKIDLIIKCTHLQLLS